VFIARAMCGLTYVTVAALCFSCSLLCISNSDWATENEAGRSVGVNGNEGPHWRDLSPVQFNCNCNYSLITHNKTPVHSTWGLLRVCAACPTPRLNLSSELRPSGNNVLDTFPTGSAQDTTRSCDHIRSGKSVNIAYSDGVFVDSGIQHSKRMRPCHLSPVRLCKIFLRYLKHGTVFERQLFNVKCVVWFSLQLSSETFIILRSTDRDMIKNVYLSSCKVPVILVRF